jgi:CubicO group peptidase (beta-lactamase class C family)
MYPVSSTLASQTLNGGELLDRLSSLPLLHQPGTVWAYGFGLDVLGLVIESISEQSLGQYMQANVWKPLGMSTQDSSSLLITRRVTLTHCPIIP